MQAAVDSKVAAQVVPKKLHQGRPSAVYVPLGDSSMPSLNSTVVQAGWCKHPGGSTARAGQGYRAQEETQASCWQDTPSSVGRPPSGQTHWTPVLLHLTGCCLLYHKQRSMCLGVTLTDHQCFYISQAAA